MRVDWYFYLRLSSYLNDFRGFDHRILPGDGFPAGGFVIVAAVVSIGVPMIGAEEFSAPTSESGQTDLPPAAGAPIDLSLHRQRRYGRLLLQISARPRRGEPPIRQGEARRAGSKRLLQNHVIQRLPRRRRRDGSGCGRGHGGCGRRRGVAEALLAKVVSRGDAGDAARDAQGDGLRYDLELRLLLLRPLRHRLGYGSLQKRKTTDSRIEMVGALMISRERNGGVLERERGVRFGWRREETGRGGI